MKKVVLAGALFTTLVTGACSSSSTSSSASATSTGSVGASLNVFAAASLTGAFSAAQPVGLRVTYNFGGSNALATQLTNGAPADVFASADQANMTKLVTAGVVQAPVVFARNTLEIAVAPGNPKHIAGLADLARADVSVVLAGPGVPAGGYTRSVAARAGVTITPKSLEPDVKSAVTKVTSGEVDATVVYVTDVRAAGAKVSGVTIPAEQNIIATYPIAVVAKSTNKAAADAFIRSAVSGEVQASLQAAGFLPPT